VIDVSVIIVSWNTADILRDCLNSLYHAPTGGLSLEVIVVDSASTDSTVAMLEAEFPQVIRLPQAQNLGFSRCNNIGLAVARGRHVLLLNPDTLIIGDALARLSAYLDANPAVGIVGPHTLNADRQTTQSTRRRFPNRRLAFLESTWLEGLAPRGWLAAYRLDDRDDRDCFEVDWVQGSCLMARREVYEQIGGLDEGFVMFYEEMDWCRRAREAGWRAAYVGAAQIVHLGGKSTEQASARKHIYYNESRLRYFHKVYGAGFASVLRMVLLTGYLYQMGVEGLKGMLGHRPDLRRQRVAVYREVLRSGLRVR
jgi:GT2 family glycosyltransferase